MVCFVLFARLPAAVPNASGALTFQHIISFDYQHVGNGPYAALVQGADGALYGTTSQGGNPGVGTVFKLNQDGTDYVVLKNFDYVSGTGPMAALVQGADGALYGTAVGGGSSGFGTVFKLNPDGTGFTVLKNFVRADGAFPYAGLIQATDGALYGTTYYGGSSGVYGTVFKLNPDGTGFTVLKNFGHYSDGANPYAGLIQATDGVLYGTTTGGGFFSGTVFKLNLDGSGFTVLKSFDYYSDGAYPRSVLLQATDGALYGTAYNGGSSAAHGTVFKLNLDGSGFTVLKRFDSYYSDGAYPHAGLIQATDGTLYGTTWGGGSRHYGTVFMLNLDGIGFTVVKAFGESDYGGHDLPAALVEGADGALYGTTYRGGALNQGTVFRLVSQDTTPPSVNCPANLSVEATSAAGAMVTFTATANDEVDGPLTPTCAPASGSTFPVGTTTVTCTAMDAANNQGSCAFTVTVVDTTAPGVNCPASGTVDATSAAGAVVTFAATAYDVVDGPLTPTCTPASGSTFSFGTTTVTCTATDAANNQGSCTFTVTVLTPQQMVRNLIGRVLALVNAGVLNSGNGNALTSKPNAASQQMDQGNLNAALNQLQAFINEVNAFVSAGKLTVGQAQPLITAANAIIQALGGP